MNSTSKLKPGEPLVLYFNVHQPKRLKKFGFLDIGDEADYWNDSLNALVTGRVARNCYIPVNSMLRRLIERDDNIRLTFSISGPAITQFESFAPEALQSFHSLVGTGCVELLGETSHHSLASMMANDEFPEQIRKHSSLMQHHFGVAPTVFRNTEMIYSNSIGSRVKQLGFKGILCEGVLPQDNRGLYLHPFHKDFKILSRDFVLSDDIAFRFENGHHKLDVDEFFKKIEQAPGVTMIGVDYETFGEHRHAHSGIIQFLHDLIVKVTQSKTVTLMTPSEVIMNCEAAGTLDSPDFTSWADERKDISAWLDSELQNEAFIAMQGVEDQVKKSGNPDLVETFRNLQTSDHFYYMSTKNGPDGEVHAVFSHYNSPYEAYINYMNVLNDFKVKLAKAPAHDPIEALEYERRHEPVPLWAEKAQANYYDLTSR